MKKVIGKNIHLLIFSLIFLALFFITFALIKNGFFQEIDDLINSYFSTPSSPLLTRISLILTFLFDPLSVIIISLIIFILLFFGKFKRDSLFFLAASLLGGILILFFKEIFQRIRPENLYESGFGFPSGHATVSIVLFCSLIYFSFENIKNDYKYLISGISIGLILMIMFSRFYLGVHWFSDMLGGIFLGTFVFLFIFFLFRRGE